jgi:hypothetical protein
MKITNENTQLNPGTSISKESTRPDPATIPGDELMLEGLSQKPSFASVLDRVTQSRKDKGDDHTQEHSDGPTPPAETRTREQDDSDEPTALAFGDSSTPGGPVISTEIPTDVRAVLPPMDLDSIVAACQVQVTAGGQREVILDLSHTVLNGLRVKLSANSTGGITTEFLAANEGVKTLLDARSAELIALLRTRGINLTAFKSSVAADANSGGETGSEQDHKGKLEGVSQTATTSTIAESESDPRATDELAIGATYRA